MPDASVEGCVCMCVMSDGGGGKGKGEKKLNFQRMLGCCFSQEVSWLLNSGDSFSTWREEVVCKPMSNIGTLE